MEYSGMQSVAKGPAAQSVSENTPSMPNPQAAAEKSLSADQLFAMAKMAYTQWEYGKLERARTIFQTLVMQKPNEPWFRCALGSIYQRQKQFAAALQQYNIALQINARDIPSRVNRGEIHLKIGKQQEAINDLMYAVKADATGKHPSALRAKSLLKAISLNPKNNPRGIPNGVV
jgi:predicted Zn-dependent protease